MLISCGKCGALVTETAIYCSVCGVHLAETAPPPNTRPFPLSKAGDSPLTKAASVLAKASGLTKSPPTSRFGVLVRGLTIAAGLLLAVSAYLVYRTQNSGGIVSVLNIESPLDRSNQLVMAGRQSLAQDDIPSAIARFEEAEKQVPNNTGVIKELADLYEAIGQVDNALNKYARVLEIDPKNLASRYQRARLQWNRGAGEKAIEDFQYLITYAPTSEQANMARQVLSKVWGKRPLDSLPERQALAARPRQRVPELPEVYGLPQQLAVTLPNLVNGVAVTPPASFSSPEESNSARALALQHKKKGQSFINAKMYYSAIKALQDARKLTPQDGDLNYLLGHANFSINQFAQARYYYEQCTNGDYKDVARNAARRARQKEQEEQKLLAKKAKKEETSNE